MGVYVVKITLRMAKKAKRKERFIDGLFFEADDSKVFIGLFPVPEWANDAKCKDCGEPARFLVENLEFICGSCVKNYLGNTELKIRKVLSSPSLERAVNASIFEWSVTGERWYRIKGNKIQPDTNLIIPEGEMLRRFYERTELILAGNSQEFEADYDKSEKTLTVYI